jgi:hypothetical protein
MSYHWRFIGNVSIAAVLLFCFRVFRRPEAVGEKTILILGFFLTVGLLPPHFAKAARAVAVSDALGTRKQAAATLAAPGRYGKDFVFVVDHWLASVPWSLGVHYFLPGAGGQNLTVLHLGQQMKPSNLMILTMLGSNEML